MGLPDYVIMGELYVLEGRESDFNTWRTSLAYHRRRRRAWGSVATDLKCLVTPTLDNNHFCMAGCW